MTNVIHVTSRDGDDDKSFGPHLCVRYRTFNKKVGGKNLCVIKYCRAGERENVQYAIAASDPRGAHSEPNAFAQILKTVAPRAKIEILAVFTERAPCQTGPGMANCDGYLYSVFLGQRLPDGFDKGSISFPYGRQTPVYYQHAYASGGKAELDYILAANAAAGIQDDPDDDGTLSLREFWAWLAKVDRQDVTKALKQIH